MLESETNIRINLGVTVENLDHVPVVLELMRQALQSIKEYGPVVADIHIQGSSIARLEQKPEPIGQPDPDRW